ncbi:transglutaminase-like domain-containing protein [Paenibacillus sp. BR2-3]|uniref:transglutaminase-like domain-containing protein n=1 Tax=Paenibacillus sp. BR2-3 TaxID=3048494 RepID=UPI0039772FF9
MKKVYFMLLTLFVVATSVQVTTADAATTDSSWLNTSKLTEGVIGIEYEVPKDKRTKLMITKDNNSYTYNLFSSQQNERFPLQQGNGSYKVTVLENTTGNKYRTVYSAMVQLSLSNTNVVYLNSVQNIKWSSSDKAIQRAQLLTQGKKTDEEKVKAIYNYIVKNVQYDYGLASSVSSDYIPNIDNTLTDKKGICYDYSSLFAAMLRSVDIPTKLVMGNTSYVSQYHAWNEVLLNGKWVTIDTTVDAGLIKNKKTATLIKSSNKYTTAKVY